ncbi:hypothetical protein DTL42_03350 [Bremerella cremea]|uniref:Carboxypeptidase regulatory-like domain-containing protein n=1 Tax=Bremerella cremea TaxID=1031537 RepID=A0A368KV11_9BACT|nr:hypothetical protein [Bremerella cremea]RCS54199.1 hypothetical protein DTL42_03350 [Bremerella cremea]
MRSFGFAVGLLGILAVGGLGCGSQGNVAPVAGTITLDGAPLEGAAVSFQPIATDKDSMTVSGMGSYGRTDAQGHYELKMIETDGEGASVGTHRVQVSVAEEKGGDALTTDKVPARYRGADSELTFDVPTEGTKTANFDLTTKRKR